MNRRATLTLAGTGIIGLLTGCSDRLPDLASAEPADDDRDVVFETTIRNELRTFDFDAEEDDVIYIKAVYEGDDQGTLAVGSPRIADNEDLYRLPFAGTREEQFDVHDAGTYTVTVDADREGEGTIELTIWIG
jgi:hypothetical protein